jgi:hypothetical protein
MATIHHNTAKRAAAHQVVLTMVDGLCVASQGDVVLASHADPKIALDRALDGGDDSAEQAEVEVEQAEAEVEQVEQAEQAEVEVEVEVEQAEHQPGDEYIGKSASVVRNSYKLKYQPHGATCGDDLAYRLREDLKTIGDDGEERIDLERLLAFAIANDCWVSTYARLNPGMQRMNVVNRLRAKVRKGHEVVWL